MEIGDPSGVGTYGVLEDNGSQVRCHECGGWYATLGHHVRAHGLSPVEYRARHGLPVGFGLVAGVTRARMSEAGREKMARRWHG